MCFIDATAVASSALNEAENALSADEKLWAKSEERYHNMITPPIARNIEIKLQHLLYVTGV